MLNASAEVRVAATKMEAVCRQMLLREGFNENFASQLASVFTGNSLDGVNSHGINRFMRFILDIRKGNITLNTLPTQTSAHNGLEQWNGNSAAGITNALFCTERAILLADKYGIGCVALANTNHWMRAGTYGRVAAQKGYAFICWSNTIANMPPWGATDNRLGNNPIVFAVPYNDDAIVLDMALSQFSYGALEKNAATGQTLPVPGGYNINGEVSTDPKAIMASRRTLPIGYWKGAGFSLLLDVLAAVLTGGNATFQITQKGEEIGVSQVFIAFKLQHLSHLSSINQLINDIVDNYHGSNGQEAYNNVLYPGERVKRTREDNERNGILVQAEVWNKVLAHLQEG